MCVRFQMQGGEECGSEGEEGEIRKFQWVYLLVFLVGTTRVCESKQKMKLYRFVLPDQVEKGLFRLVER